MTTTSHAPTVTTVATVAPLAAVDLRPAAHFTARDTWLNDPNGLLHHDGVYHLFFQNNPNGSVWGDISWCHATSRDLVSWEELPVAIAATAEEMVFSGSAVADVRNTAGFAGPDQTALVAVYTSSFRPGTDRAGIQAQSLAYSLDGGGTWERYAGNPVLDIGSTDFRDPKVFWYGGEDGHWVMVVVEALERRVAIYTSPNLTDWALASRFGPAGAVQGVWECPDLFPLRVEGTDETRWVMVVSLNPGGIAGGSGTQYMVGSFDGTTFTADPPTPPVVGEPSSASWLDFGRDYYAAVSFNDAPDDRRLTIAWASNWDYAHATPTQPWRSAMSLVRELTLVRTADGRLLVTQVPVLPDHDPRVLVADLTIPSGPGSRSRVVLSPDPAAGTSRVVLTLDGDSRTLACDRTAAGSREIHPLFPSIDVAPLLGGDPTDVRIVIDGCVLEVFLDGGLSTITQLVFPDAPLTRVDLVTE